MQYYISFRHTTVIPHLYTLQSDHYNKSINHLSPIIVITLLTILLYAAHYIPASHFEVATNLSFPR